MIHSDTGGLRKQSKKITQLRLDPISLKYLNIFIFLPSFFFPIIQSLYSFLPMEEEQVSNKMG